uniref:NADH-ubiquinone oxidoreductase chain 2 n=1 Tax=Armadillidium album TaxID=96802 RepID=A0A1P8DKI7_9CRUS|nr:NADH dehydrogenase subunit 2 [Armadillidium album]
MNFLGMNRVSIKLSMLLGVWVSIHSDSWFGVWIGLELNLLCFIPFLTQSKETYSEPGVKYFLIQACASFLLLMSGVSMLNYSLFMNVFISCALLLKLGAAPYYFWYLSVGEGVTWFQFLGLSTIQKIAPLVLLFFSEVNLKISGWLISLSIILSGFVGGVGGVNELSFRKLLVYSSINHLGWIMVPLLVLNEFWLIYFLVYCLLISMVVIILLVFGLYHMNQLFNISISFVSKITLAVSLLSLGGLPPLLGFFPKLVIIEFCSGGLMHLIMYAMIISSVMTLFYYMRVLMSSVMLNFDNMKFLMSKMEILSCSFMMVVSMLGGLVYYLVFKSFLQ